MRIELTPKAWEAPVLPLNYTRNLATARGRILSAVAVRFNPRPTGDTVRHGTKGDQARGFR